MTSIIEYVATRACEKFNHNGNEFSTANFQSELSRLTDSRPMITSAIAEAILLSVPGVARGKTLCMWTYTVPREAA